MSINHLPQHPAGMAIRFLESLLLPMILAAWSGPVSAEAASPLRAGAATAEITPQAGVSLDGPISKNGLVTGVHDPCFARRWSWMTARRGWRL